MNTIYVILLVAVFIILLILKFIRIDETKAAKQSAERTTGRAPKSLDLFAEKPPEQPPAPINADVAIKPETAASQADPAPDNTEDASPDRDEGVDESPESQNTEELAGENTLILYAVSNYGVFTGTALLEIAALKNLRLEGNVFHKYDEENNVCYRVANGTGEMGFEFIHSANFQTQAIAITIAFPETRSPVRAYGSMRSFAELMVQDLGAVLKDAEHNRITSQTLNYYKDNVVSYQLMNRGRHGQG